MVHLRVEYCLILTVAGFVFYCTKNVRNELGAFLYSAEWFGTKLPSSERFSHLRNGLGTEFHCARIYRSSFRKNKPKTLVSLTENECCWLFSRKLKKSLNSGTGEFTTRTYVVFALIFPLFILLQLCENTLFHSVLCKLSRHKLKICSFKNYSQHFFDNQFFKRSVV